MGDPQAQPRVPSAVELQGRIAELEGQRAAAMSRCTVLAGHCAEVVDLLTQARAETAACRVEIERLTAVVASCALPPMADGAAH